MDPREKREDESWAEYGARMASMGVAPVESPMLAGPMVNRFRPTGSDYTPRQLRTPIRQLQQQNIPQNVVPIRPMDATLAGMATVPAGLRVKEQPSLVDIIDSREGTYGVSQDYRDFSPMMGTLADMAGDQPIYDESVVTDMPSRPVFDLPSYSTNMPNVSQTLPADTQLRMLDDGMPMTLGPVVPAPFEEASFTPSDVAPGYRPGGLDGWEGSVMDIWDGFPPEDGGWRPGGEAAAIEHFVTPIREVFGTQDVQPGDRDFGMAGGGVGPTMGGHPGMGLGGGYDLSGQTPSLAGTQTGMDVAPDAGGAVGGYPTMDADYGTMATEEFDFVPSVPADPTGGMIDADALAGRFDVGPTSVAQVSPSIAGMAEVSQAGTGFSTGGQGGFTGGAQMYDMAADPTWAGDFGEKTTVDLTPFAVAALPFGGALSAGGKLVGAGYSALAKSLAAKGAFDPTKRGFGKTIAGLTAAALGLAPTVTKVAEKVYSGLKSEPILNKAFELIGWKNVVATGPKKGTVVSTNIAKKSTGGVKKTDQTPYWSAAPVGASVEEIISKAATAPKGAIERAIEKSQPAKPSGPSAADIERQKQAAINERLARQATIRQQQQQAEEIERARMRDIALELERSALAREEERIRQAAVAAEQSRVAQARRALEIIQQQQADKTAADQTARVRNEVARMLNAERDRGHASEAEIDAAIEAQGFDFGGVMSLPDFARDAADRASVGIDAGGKYGGGGPF